MAGVPSIGFIRAMDSTPEGRQFGVIAPTWMHPEGIQVHVSDGAVTERRRLLFQPLAEAVTRNFESGYSTFEQAMEWVEQIAEAVENPRVRVEAPDGQ